MKKVGLLYDSISGNMGDSAIGIVLSNFLSHNNIPFSIVNPFNFNPDDYAILIIGGGLLLRDKGDSFYDNFRVPGRHILNTMGIMTTQDLDYLNEYELVGFRTKSENDSVKNIIHKTEYCPCIALLMEGGTRDAYVISDKAVGIHIDSRFIGVCNDIIETINNISQTKVFIPITHYTSDKELMENLPLVGDFSILPKMDPGQIFSTIGKLDFLITSSMHAAIFAYIQNVPFLALYSDKIKNFLKDRNLEKWMFKDSKELMEKIALIKEQRPDFSQSIVNDKTIAREFLEKIKTIALGRVAVSEKTFKKNTAKNDCLGIIGAKEMEIYFLRHAVANNSCALGIVSRTMFMKIEAEQQKIISACNTIKQKNQEMGLIRSSKFWRLRDKYLAFKNIFIWKK